MTKLPKLLTSSRNAEVNAVAGRISSAFHESSLEGNLILTPVFGEIDPLVSQLTEAIDRMLAESKLEQKDEVRDQKHHSLYYFVYGLTFSATEAIQTAAQQLFAVLEHYGLAITDDNYDTETSEIRSLLVDLAAPKLAASIAALDGCATLIADLQNAQDDFEAARLAYQKERGQEKQLTNATELKRELLKVVNAKLIAVLNGLLVSDPASYGDFASTVQEVIEVNNETVKKRRPKKVDTSESV